MTITSRFYDTTPGNGIKENEWAASAVSRGATYGVVGDNGLDLTPHPSTPYTLNIGPALEGFWGHGVWDVSDVQVTLPAVTPPATNATRWDLVAARRDWQPTGGGPTALVVVEGTIAKALPANRENTPGEVDDQPLWLVQWRGGDTQPIATIDLRCWAGPGGVEAADLLALSYLGFPGSAVKVGGTVWRYELQANGVWGWSDGNAGWESLALGSTPGVTGVRGAGSWVPTSGSVAPSVRLRAGGDIIHVRGEVKYVNSTSPEYLPDEGWVIATIPAGMRPSEMTFITGTSDTYRKSQVFTVNPDGSIRLGPNPTGLVYQFNGIVPN